MKRIVAFMTMCGTFACGAGTPAPAGNSTPSATERKYLLERVDDAAVVQVYADGFRDLPVKEKKLIWHLYQAAIAGRDIFYDQRYAHNVEMRDVLEAIVAHPGAIDSDTLSEIQRYTKLFWLNTGPYNNLTAQKFVMRCTPVAFAAAAHAAQKSGAQFPLRSGETLDQLLARLRPTFFDASVDATVTSKTPPPGKDILTASANNLYIGLTMKDLDGYREGHPLNSRLVKSDGRIVADVYRIGGRYRGQISASVKNFEEAIPYSGEPMAKPRPPLIKFYQTREAKDPGG